MQHSHRHRLRTSLAATVALVAVLGAGVSPSTAAPLDRRHDGDEEAFAHVGTFDVRDNGTTVAEIVDSTKDGRTLVYTDSATGKVGFVDIRNPKLPVAAGTITLGGEPTSVGITDKYALVSVDTSSSFVDPSGTLFVIDLTTRAIVRTIELGGQPDAVDVSPDGQYATIVIENQRNESVNGALIPQLPAGGVIVVDIKGKPAKWTTKLVNLTNLPGMYAPSDPEPEYIDINNRNQAVVSLQENNHLAIIDLRTAKVTASFSAGTVDLVNVDAVEEKLGPQRKGRIILDDSVLARRREPDTVAWIDNKTFVTANEGDYTDENGKEGGSRGFTLFDTTGTVVFEAGPSFEYEAIRAGHFNETRAANKGAEPEALTVAKFGDQTLLFVGGERSNVVGVYDVSKGTPKFLQLLPTGIGPEGMTAIPKRDLLVVAAETAAGIFPSMITIYERDDDNAPSMTLVSGNDANGLPLPWNAISGLTAEPNDPNTLYGVSDSVLAEAGIHTIDVSSVPAVITRRVLVADAAGTVRNDLDLEGIAAAPEGGFWLASEGRVTVGSARPNLIVKVDANGVVQSEMPLPAALVAGAGNNGLEGVAVSGSVTTQYVYVAIQRPWASDPAETVKIGRYEVATDAWTFVQYVLDAVTLPTGAVIGLSEITSLPNGTFAIIERDGLAGTQAVQKKIYGVDLATADFQPFGSPLVTVPKVLLADVLDELQANTIYTPDKLEGLAVAADGEVYMVTDNDGLDSALGQTLFLGLGPVGSALAG